MACMGFPGDSDPRDEEPECSDCGGPLDEDGCLNKCSGVSDCEGCKTLLQQVRALTKDYERCSKLYQIKADHFREAVRLLYGSEPSNVTSLDQRVKWREQFKALLETTAAK
jgi:hypothetical protein